jgi:single-stranded DNA-specific DHH superfamily exonuclease
MGYKTSKIELERFKDFLSTEGSKILLYHNDPDGICSARLLLKFFPGFEKIPRTGPMISDEFLDVLIKKKPKLVFFMDLPVDQEKKRINKMQKETGCRIIILDHHIYENNLDSRDILHINPRFKQKGSYIPSACMIYRILERTGFDVKELCWVAVMGVIGDYVVKDCMDLLEECKNEYPYLLKETPLESKLAEGAGMISYAVIMKGSKGAGEALKVLMKSIDYKEFADDKKLIKWKEEMEREFDFVLKDAEKEEHKKMGLIIYTIKTRFSITSMIATHFSEKHEDKIIIVKRESKNGWKLCLRDQSGRTNLGEIVKKCVKGIGSGGGHERAAGVMTTDWEKFKERFTSSIKAS